jgi:hypothetical protein
MGYTLVWLRIMQPRPTTYTCLIISILFLYMLYMFACNPEQVALLRLLSSFEWDVKPIILVPGAYASGKQKTPSKWETWVACDGLLLPGQRRSH